MTWKTSTCERCVFRVDKECRRFPPDSNMNYSWVRNMVTARVYEYAPACAEYSELIEPPKTTEESSPEDETTIIEIK